ncbi:MAG: hypothetical protein U1E65_04290 [Myxococcota bacterium]
MRSLSLFALALAACATTPKAEGPAPLETGAWNDVDADQVAEALIGAAKQAAFAETWSAAHQGKTPKLRLYPIRNRSAEYINHRFFTKRLEAALVATKKVEVVLAVDEQPKTSDGELEDVRDQADDKAQGRHDADVDLVLNGWILTQEESDATATVRSYLTTLEVVEVASEKKLWLGEKRIRKRIER